MGLLSHLGSQKWSPEGGVIFLVGVIYLGVVLRMGGEGSVCFRVWGPPIRTTGLPEASEPKALARPLHLYNTEAQPQRIPGTEIQHVPPSKKKENAYLKSINL